MINPKSSFRMTWDLAALLPLLLYLTVMMPFRLCFANDPKPFTGIYVFEFAIDMIFIADIFLNFFTGVILDNDDPHDSTILVECVQNARLPRAIALLCCILPGFLCVKFE